MSTQYNTEPPPTASVLLHTTAGPLQLSIFAHQTPLTSRNFLQHCLDGTYDNCTFHRVSPGFVVQTGDPTNTGEGGQNIYELEKEYERYNALWARELGREVGEKIEFKDEIHGRLKFNRRGLVGMAKMGDGYGSQFFVTLADCRRQLDGQCTMFGRVEGDGIYNVVKISEGELVEGGERPTFPEKILRAEVLEMPKGEAWRAMKKRERVVSIAEAVEERPKKVQKRDKKKGGKALLSFGDEGEGEDLAVKPKKAKFNPILIEGDDEVEPLPRVNGSVRKKAISLPTARQKARSPSPKPVAQETSHSASPSASRSPETSHHRRPSFHDSTIQLPLRDPEVPSRSRSPSTTPPTAHKRRRSSNLQFKTSDLQAEIAALKASIRRGPDALDVNNSHRYGKPRSALEQMIPTTSIRGRKRPRPGESTSSKADTTALKMLSAFKARLDGADRHPISHSNSSRTGPGLNPSNGDIASPPAPPPEPMEDEEAALCDLHFVANCQSCRRWDNPVFAEDEAGRSEGDAEQEGEWMSHSLKFEKDRLGKDLTWRKKAEEELVVIDPREKEKEIKRESRRDRRERHR